MKSNRGRPETTGAPDDGIAARQAVPLLYLERLSAVIGTRCSDATPATTQPLILLIPPGIDGEALCYAVFDGLECSVEIFSSDTDTRAQLERAGPTLGHSWIVIVDPVRLPKGDLDSILLLRDAAEGSGFIFVSAVPLSLVGPERVALACDVLGHRDFRYRENEFLCLIEGSRSNLEHSARAGSQTDPHNLFELTQGWPLISELAIADVYKAASKGGSTSASIVQGCFSLAQLPSVKRHFEDCWLPLIESRYRWLIEVSTLPLLSLDLLDALFDKPIASVRECLLVGWLEPCPKKSGFYQINSAIDVLLLSVFPQFENRPVLERAAQWYREQGYLPEAVECLVSFVDNDRLLEILGDAERLTPLTQDSRARSLRESAPLGSLSGASSVAKDSLKPSFKDSREQWASAILANLGASRPDVAEASSFTAGSSGPGLDKRSEGDAAAQAKMAGILEHLATAFRHHQGDNAKAVSSAIAEAVDAGIERQYLTVVLDFVDLHIRPLLRNQGSPLQLALRDLKHSAPAREVVEAQYRQLNHRELQILKRVCEGYKNQEISEQLGLELSTIKWYATGIYEKLQVRNRTQAVAKAQALKLFG